MTRYVAALRVYEPLAAFPPPQRQRWEAYVADGRAPDRAAGAELEQRAALAAIVAAPPQPAPPGTVEHAYVLEADGTTLICPWRLRLRCWEAAAEFLEGLPDEIADAFIPTAVAQDAAAELAQWRAARPEVSTSVRTSRWQVPLSWFIVVDKAERQLDLRRRSLRYQTSMARARRRMARALALLRRRVEDGPVIEAVEELGRWLEEFHPHSVVELDYGGLVDLVDDEALHEDDSAADMARSLAALSDGDAVAAGEAYERLLTRWQTIAATETAN